MPEKKINPLLSRRNKNKEFMYIINQYSQGDFFPTDAINEYLFSNNLTDTGSQGNDLIQSVGVIGDIMTTDRNGNPNSAMRSSNSVITLQTTSVINFQKEWSINWWQLADSPGSENVFLLYRAGLARFARFTAAAFEWRPDVGTTASVTHVDYLANVWQNIHVDYGNGLMEVFINGVSQGTSSNADHTIPLTVSYVGTFNAGSSTDTSVDDIRIFNRPLTLSEITAIYDAG